MSIKNKFNLKKTLSLLCGFLDDSKSKTQILLPYSKECGFRFMNIKVKYFWLLALETIILCFLFVFFINSINGGVGAPNVTVITKLNVTGVTPEIIIIELNGGSSISLNANATKIVQCVGLLRDYNNESYLRDLSAKLFHNTNSLYSNPDDNNNHYSNDSCNISLSFGSWKGISNDKYLALGNCSFTLQYYSDPGDWNCTMYVNNTYNLIATNNTNRTINELIALGLPNTIDYGAVNATFVSNENITNVSNAGNVKINLSLKGWAVSQGDNQAMNCTQGSIKNISIMHEKYNLSISTPGDLTLDQTVGNYTNLTSSAVIKPFSLNYRQEDDYDDATNATYWRIYVPLGVAGSCQGNVQFGATKSTGA